MVKSQGFVDDTADLEVVKCSSDRTWSHLRDPRENPLFIEEFPGRPRESKGLAQGKAVN